MEGIGVMNPSLPIKWEKIGLGRTKNPRMQNFDSNYENYEECNEGYYLINNELLHCSNAPLNDSYFRKMKGRNILVVIQVSIIA